MTSRPVVNLAEIRTQFESAHPATVTECAKFKDESDNRVIADSRDFVIYTLRVPSQLRVLVKNTSPAGQLAFKEHKQPVTAAKFISAVKTNIVASSSASELLIWFIGKDSCESYLAIPAKVTNFAWLPIQGRAPDMLLLLASGKVLHFRSSTLIQSQIEAGADDLKTETVTLEDHSAVVTESVGAKAPPLVCASAPILAFAVDECRIVTCTRHNYNTPPWNPIIGTDDSDTNKLIDMAMPLGPLLVAASASSISLWDVAAEPKPLQRIVTGVAKVKIVGIKAMPLRIVALLVNDEAQQSESAVLKLPDGVVASAVSFYKNPDPPPVNVALSSAREDEPLLLCDFSSSLRWLSLENGPWNEIDTGAAVSAPSAGQRGNKQQQQGGGKKQQNQQRQPSPQQQPNRGMQSPPPNYHQQQVQPPVPRSMQQQQQQQTQQQLLTQFQIANQLGPNNSASVTPLGQPQQQVVVGGGSLRNPSLPQAPASQPSQALGQQLDSSSQAIDKTAQDITNAVSNAESMMGLVQNMVRKDHESLLKTALQAQRETIAATIKRSASSTSSNGNGGASPAADSCGDIADQILLNLVPVLAPVLVESITQATEESVKSALEPALRTAMSKQVKRANKDATNQLKGQIDAIAKDVVAACHEEFTKKQSAYSAKLLGYCSDLSIDGFNGMMQLQKVVVQQQELIDAYQNSGIIEEIRRLRKEVETLKEQAAQRGRGGGASEPTGHPNADATVPVETILSNAKALMASDSPATGLSWVLNLQSPDLTYELLSSVSRDAWERSFEDQDMTDDMYRRVIFDLTSTPNPERLIRTLEILVDILGDRPQVKVPQVVDALNAYMGVWRSNQSSVPTEAKNHLRELMIMLRR